MAQHLAHETVYMHEYNQKQPLNLPDTPAQHPGYYEKL